MDSANSATVINASTASLGSVQEQSSVSVLKKAMNAQAASAVQLIASLPQPGLASSGGLGTRVNTFA